MLSKGFKSHRIVQQLCEVHSYKNPTHRTMSSRLSGAGFGPDQQNLKPAMCPSPPQAHGAAVVLLPQSPPQCPQPMQPGRAGHSHTGDPQDSAAVPGRGAGCQRDRASAVDTALVMTFLHQFLASILGAALPPCSKSLGPSRLPKVLPKSSPYSPKTSTHCSTAQTYAL